MIFAEQPHRVVPHRRRPTTWPWSEHPEIEAPGRPFPCGYTDGGFLAGPGDECRAADVLIEDAVSPPLYCDYARQEGRCMVVDSTHFETVVKHRREGMVVIHHRIHHVRGLSFGVMSLTHVQRRMLQRFAHESSEATGKRYGWAQWAYRPRDHESPDDIKQMAAAGLIEIRREFMDNWIKLTDVGWAAL